MILAWWLFVGTLVATVALIVAMFATDDAAWGFIAWLPGIAACIFLIGGLVVSLGRHYGRVSCHTFSAQTGRPTKFVIYTAWDGGDCLTPDGSGHWIPTKNLREFGSKP